MAFRRSIRNMMDASLDLTGTEKILSSENTGWTTQVANYYVNNQPIAFLGYNTFGDATLDATGNPDPQFPHQDGVTRNTSNNTLTITGTINVGFKHYMHQLQAMRGSDDFGGSSPMGGPGVGFNFPGLGNINPSLNGVPAVGTFSGTSNLYKITNIKIGDMRGFKYHLSTSGIWNASTGTGAIVEELRALGIVKIGNTV